MKKFKVGDLVFGKVYYGEEPDLDIVSYLGRITKCYDDGWYRVESRDDGWDVEPHAQDTMEHATKLHKLLAGDDNV